MTLTLAEYSVPMGWNEGHMRFNPDAFLKGFRSTINTATKTMENFQFTRYTLGVSDSCRHIQYETQDSGQEKVDKLTHPSTQGRSSCNLYSDSLQRNHEIYLSKVFETTSWGVIFLSSPGPQKISRGGISYRSKLSKHGSHCSLHGARGQFQLLHLEWMSDDFCRELDVHIFFTRFW